MASWDELNAKYSAVPATTTTTAPREGWSELSKKHAMPAASITSTKPDNSALGMAQQRVVLDMSPVQRGLASVGAGLSDLGMTAKQLVGKATPADVDEKRKIDAVLTPDPISAGLKFVSELAPTLAIPFGSVGRVVAKVAPRLAPAVEGAVQGGVTAGLAPVGTGDSRLFNTISGAGVGGVVPGAVGAVRGAIGSTSPEAAALAKTALEKYNIPLQASDVTDSKFLKSLNSMFGDMPLTGGMATARRDAKQTAFNRAVGNTIGADSDRLTADVVQAAHQKMTGNFNDIYTRNPADAFKVNAALDPVLNRVAKEGTDEQKQFIQSRLNELNSNIDDATGTINGSFFNGWQSDLGSAAGNDHLKSQFRKAAIKGYNEGLTGADASLLSETKLQYRNFKTINPLLDKAPTGDISPGLLQGRVASNFDDYSRGGGGDLGELARIGSRFMVDRTPQTGGSGRGMLQNSIVANAVALPTIAPLALAMNSNPMRDAILNKSLGTGLFNSAPVGLLGDLTQKTATQALPLWATQGGLLSF